MTQAQREDRREYERIKAEVKRRRAGVKPRKLKRRPLPQNGTVTYLPIMPLSRWLDELVEQRGFSRVVRSSGIADKALRRVQKRKTEGGDVIRRLTLEEVDRMLTKLGYPEELVILYPTEED